MTNWLHRLNFGFTNLDNLKRFDTEMRKRPAVQTILKQEGLPHSLQDES